LTIRDALFTECAEDLPTLGIDPWSSGSPSGGQGSLKTLPAFTSLIYCPG
jgi:hypothetical protein